jgi:uncharacterized protein YcfL
MKKAILLSLIAFMLLTIGCSSSDHFLTDAKYRAQVEQDFKPNRNCCRKAISFPFSTIRRFP